MERRSFFGALAAFAMAPFAARVCDCGNPTLRGVEIVWDPSSGGDYVGLEEDCQRIVDAEDCDWVPCKLAPEDVRYLQERFGWYDP